MTDDELKLLSNESRALTAMGQTDGWLRYLRPLLREKIAGGGEQFLNLKIPSSTAAFEQLRGACAFALELIQYIDERPRELEDTLDGTPGFPDTDFPE